MHNQLVHGTTMMHVWKLRRNCIWNINYSESLKMLPYVRYEVPTLKDHVQQFKIHAKIRCPHYRPSLSNKNKLFYYATRSFTSLTHAQKYQCPIGLFSSDQNKDKHLLLPSVSSSIRPAHVRHLSGEVGDFNLWTRVFLWMSESTPVSYAQEFLLFIHSSSGLPWWTTVILTTVFVRTVVTLPLAIYQNYILAKVENLQLVEMPEIIKELKRETAAAIKKFNWTEKEARIVYNRSVKKQWTNLILRDNCHPFKASVLLWVQIPMWVCLSVALRNLVYMLPHQDGGAMITYMELSVGGFGWIPNLLLPDESLVLPVALGLINLAIVELQLMSKIRKDSKIQKYMTNLFRGLSILMIPIAAYVPSCLALYWVTSSTYGLIQNLVLLSPKIKKLTKIPETPSQLENPYRHIATEIRSRASRIPAFWKSQAKN